MISFLQLLSSLIAFGAVLANFIMDRKHMRAVRGSHQRYVFASYHRITAWAVVAGFFFQGLIDAVQGYFVPAVIILIVSAIDAVIEIRRDKDDDWFNGRGKKIKNGIKKAFTIKVKVPSLSPAYGGA